MNQKKRQRRFFSRRLSARSSIRFLFSVEGDVTYDALELLGVFCRSLWSPASASSSGSSTGGGVERMRLFDRGERCGTPLSSSSGSGPPRFIDDSLASLVDEEETLRSEKCGLVRLKLFTRTLVRHLHHL